MRYDWLRMRIIFVVIINVLDHFLLFLHEESRAVRLAVWWAIGWAITSYHGGAIMAEPPGEPLSKQSAKAQQARTQRMMHHQRTNQRINLSANLSAT